MSPEMIVLIVVVVLLVVGIASVIAWKFPRKLKQDYFTRRWKEIQGYCRDKANWSQAIIEADQLLDRAMKKRKLKGSSMGERMVSAQKVFTDNDGIWYAHNLSKKLVAEEKVRLRESDVKAALVAFRQALRDIGALPNGQ